MVGTGALAILLWRQGHIAVGAVATAIPMAWQIKNMSGWVAQYVANIFDDIGQVQDGMRSIAVPRQMPDLPAAVEMPRIAGAIRFDKVSFDYGRTPRLGGVLLELDLDVAPGERVGLVGRSGAGKSTLVHLLLAVLPAGKGPHPDRRPRHRRADAGEPARPDRDGDAGHLAVAPLDPRQHPLRPPRRERGGDRRRRAARPRASSSSRGWRTGTAAPASTRWSASAASSCPAVSASASPSPA